MAALSMLLAAGIVSIVVGKHFLDQQQSLIEETAKHQQDKIDRLVEYHSDEMGLLLYYLRFAYINPASKLAAVSIGQRDINSSIQFPTIRTLEAQKHDTDIQNPYRSMMGNFDLSFVVLFLFPLVIIGLTFNLYSEEKERGTWALICSQNFSPRKYLLKKLSVPFLFVSGVFLLLILLSAVIVKLPLDRGFLAFILSNFLYICFWFAVVLLLISFFQTSSNNAIFLLGSWIMIVLLLPAAASNFISGKYPVPESLSMMLKQRDGYHKKWDIPEDSSMGMFFKEYPEYSSFKWTHEGFNWLWYYAMQHLGDVDARPDKDLFMEKLRQRQNLSEQISWLVPSLYTQLYNSEVAQTSLTNHLIFLRNTSDFHERLRKYFYPKIFTGSPVMQEDWKKHQPRYCEIKNPVSLVKSAYVGLFVLVIGGLGFARLNKTF
ncbi:DUF3526 domain-containing protein [Ferruginibacter sp.]